MPDQPFAIPPFRDRKPISWRWTVVLLASALIHLLALGWADGHLVLPSITDQAVDEVTTVQLEPMAQRPEPRPPQALTKAKLKHKAVRKARSAPVVAAVPAVASTALTPDMPANSDNPDPPPVDDSVAPGAAQMEPQAAPPTAVEQKADAPAAEPAPAHYKIELPPPVELRYDVKKVSADADAPIYGSGAISWQSTGGAYQVTGKASILFINLLSYKSEGVLDDYGIAPVLYSQKPFNRSETNTHFNRDERNSISFSASKLSVPRKDGAQDRASVMWELAGIGRGDREKFAPGAQIDLFVAGDRDGDTWSIQVVGQEEIETGAGKTTAWHVVRMPRAGTYEDQIDIWLAPQFEWSPVKIHYTYKKGGYLDMSMSSFHSLQLAGAQPESAH